MTSPMYATITEYASLPPDLARTHNPRPPVQRRPTHRVLSAEELAALEAEHLPWAEHREKARAMQQTPLPGQP